jgi:hypothetical protein
MKFDDVLQIFKDDEAAENIIPLIENAELRQSLVAWKSVQIKRKHDEECNADNDYDRWEWLWSAVEMNLSNWGIVAGIKPQDINPTIIRLKSLRLIYPDGTIHTLAKQYMQGLIMAKLPKRPKNSQSAQVIEGLKNAK